MPMNIILAAGVLYVFVFVLGLTIGRRKGIEEASGEDDHVREMMEYRRMDKQKEDDMPAAPGFAKRTILYPCAECEGEKGECVCSDCEAPISKWQAEYDHLCATCSYNAARR